MIPFFISVPHAGENIPPEVTWLRDLPEAILFCDTDRYVDQLYSPSVEKMNFPFVTTEWHRYVVDLNRWPEDVDQSSVINHKNPPGTFPLGYHWTKTTKGDILLREPITLQMHNLLTKKYFDPFHQRINATYQSLFKKSKKVYHLDCHSMPSQATAAHRDAGEKRPEVVISDCDGTSCDAAYKDLVIQAYKDQGFEVSYNWPYKGGRITQTYGRPKMGQHAIQVELNRKLYMDETSKKLLPAAQDLKKRLTAAIEVIYNQVPSLV